MTAEQRYQQAILKAQIIARRNLVKFMAGEIDVLPCWGDIERKCIIAQIAAADADR